MEMSGAVVAAILDIVVLGHGWDHRRAARDLADAAENDLGAAVVEFDGTADFDDASGEAADVADILQVGGKDDHAEGAGHLVFAEIDVVDAFDSSFYAQDFSGDAFFFADVVGGFLDGDAVGAGVEGDGDCEER